MLEEGTIYAYMNGRHVFKNAVIRFVEVINEALVANGLKRDDINLVIPHQANSRITETVQLKLELPPEKVYNVIANYGNTTAASIPIAMTEALKEGLIKDNSLLCLAAFGSGFTWASCLIRF
jgi:3-oxoacyl-[acyl-carrier-protein] synthase-3